MHKVNVTVAPNGARRQKCDHPKLPVTIHEIAATARACFDAGADGLHLHVRDDAGGHSLDAGRYREAIAAVSEAAAKLKIQITTESAGIYDVSAQVACLEGVRPKAASIAVREMARAPRLAARMYGAAHDMGCEVQHILYGPDCIAQLRQWFQDGIVVNNQRAAIFVLGAYVPPVLATPADLRPFLRASEGLGLDWTACAFGRDEHACLLAAAERGGHVRLGFENNIHTPDGGLLADNAASVATFLAKASQTLKETT